jgi:hypothetical protein
MELIRTGCPPIAVTANRGVCALNPQNWDIPLISWRIIHSAPCVWARQVRSASLHAGESSDLSCRDTQSYLYLPNRNPNQTTSKAVYLRRRGLVYFK